MSAGKRCGVSLRRWNWLDNGVLPLSVTILRTCWLWPWLALVQRWLVSSYRGTMLPVGLVLVLLLCSTVVARRALMLSATVAQTTVSVTGLLVIFLALWAILYGTRFPLWSLSWLRAWGTEMVTWAEWEVKGVPPAFFALLAMSYLWLQGVLEGGRSSLMRDQVWRTFTRGFVAFAVLVMAATLDKRGLPQGTGDLLWLFFATGMVALALAGLKAAGGFESTVGSEVGEAESWPRLDRYWLGSVATVIAGLLVLGMIFSALIAPDVVGQMLGTVWAVARQVLFYLWVFLGLLLLPIAYLLALALRPLFDRLTELLSKWRPVDGPFAPQLPEAPSLEDLPEGGVDLFGRIPNEFRWLALAVTIALISFVFAKALRRLVSRSTTKNGIVETRETILSRDLLQGQLAELWRSLVRRLHRQSKAAFSPFLSLQGEHHSRRIIRAVYQAVLAAARERGRPRPPGQTPIEYRHGLVEEWPNDRDVLDVITDGYVEARYAPDPPAESQAKRVGEAWEQLQLTLPPPGGDEAQVK